MSKFNRETLLGIDIAIKAVSKKYNFIVGWKLTDDAEKYNFIVYINLLINLDKTSEYFNKPITRKMGGRTSGLNSFFSTLDPLKDKEEWDKEWEFFYFFKKQIERDLYSVYESLPDEYTVKLRDTDKTCVIGICDFVVK